MEEWALGKDAGFGPSRPFRIDDPLSQQLVERVEPGTIPIRYVNGYHVKRLLPCAFCTAHTQHRRGVTAQLDDGRLALCGHCCAKKLFGEEFHAKLLTDLKQRETVDVIIGNIDKLREAINASIFHIDKIWGAQEADIDDAVSQLCEAMSPVYARKCVTPKGSLMVLEEVHERRQIKYNVKSETLGAEVFTRRRGMRDGADNLARVLGAIMKKNISYGDAQQIAKFRVKAIEDISEGIKFFEAAKVFFTKENFANFEKWLAYKKIGDRARWVEQRGCSAIQLRAAPELFGRQRAWSVLVPRVGNLPDRSDLVDPLRYQKT